MKQFTHEASKMDEFDDLPVNPAAPVEGAATSIDGTADAGMFEGVPEMGETIPMGTYHFRLEKVLEFTNKLKEEDPKVFGDGTAITDQPSFMLMWNCQQEPHTGRTFGDFAPWVSKEVREQAKKGDLVAQAMLKDRLWKMKSVMKAAGFTPTGTFDLKKDFFATHPEMKIQIGLQSSKSKNAAGKYVEDGGQQNKVIKFLPLNRPA